MAGLQPDKTSNCCPGKPLYIVPVSMCAPKGGCSNIPVQIPLGMCWSVLGIFWLAVLGFC